MNQKTGQQIREPGVGGGGVCLTGKPLLCPCPVLELEHCVPCSARGEGESCMSISRGTEGELFLNPTVPMWARGLGGSLCRPFLGQAAIETPCLAPHRQT